MRSLFRFLVSSSFFLGLLFFLPLTSLKYQLLDEDFVVSKFRQADVYPQVERGLREAFRYTVITQLPNQSINVEKLTVGERKEIERQISETASVITADKIQDATENNIVKILGFINGKNPKLTLYLPLRKWGLPLSLDADQLELFSENSDVEEIIDAGILPVKKEQIDKFFYYSTGLHNVWWIMLALLVILIVLHYFLSTSPSKTRSVAKLLIFSGGVGLGFSAVLNTLSKQLLASLPYFRGFVQILIAALLPPLTSEIIKLWIIISSTATMIGFVTISVNYLYFKRKENIEKFRQKNQGTPTPKPLAPQP